jgi:SNF family Na+-dependent transporter
MEYPFRELGYILMCLGLAIMLGAIWAALRS